MNKLKNDKYNYIIQDVFSFYYINNKYHKYIFGNDKDNYQNKISFDTARRATASFNICKKYNSITEFFNSRQFSNNSKIDENEISKTSTMNEKTSDKFIKNYNIIEPIN